MARHVGLLGLGRSLEEAPFADPSVEFWAIGSCWEAVPNWAVRRWYDLYSPEYASQRTLFWEWAKQQTTPIYFTAVSPEIPASRAFPRETVEDISPRAYFTSSIAWMLAACVAELRVGDRVSLWGINLSSSEEYRRQRPCVEYYLGRLEGMGVEVFIPDSSLLLKDSQYYGYFEDTPHRALVDAYAVGGIDTIYLLGVDHHFVSVRGIYLDPDPANIIIADSQEQADALIRTQDANVLSEV